MPKKKIKIKDKLSHEEIWKSCLEIQQFVGIIMHSAQMTVILGVGYFLPWVITRRDEGSPGNWLPLAPPSPLTFQASFEKGAAIW